MDSHPCKSTLDNCSTSRQLHVSSNDAIILVTSCGGVVFNSRLFATDRTSLPKCQSSFEYFESVQSFMNIFIIPRQQECMYSGLNALMKSKFGNLIKGVFDLIP